MKSVLFSFICVLIAITAFAKEEKKQSIKGIIEVPAKGVLEGSLYLFVIPEGATALVVEKDLEKKATSVIGATVPEPNSDGRHYQSLGKISPSTSKNFTIDLKPGKYRLSCLVKRSDPPCLEVEVDKKKVIVNCYPTKDDSHCLDQSITVEEKDISDIKLSIGLRE